MNREFWKEKKVLITGHTGFKGSWLSIWLNELGAKVIGYSLDPFSERDNFVLSKIGEKVTDIRGNILDREKLHEVFQIHQPEIVFHLAAQPIVRYSYEHPVETYETNVMGTLNVLEEIRKSSTVRAGIMITTDKCYENKEQIWGYRENDPMGGYDPYSSSKGCAELLISSYRNSFFPTSEYENHKKAIASARAGNVIGGGDWALDRIIPDCIRGLEDTGEIFLRNPQAVRPWQHVLEPLSGYMMLAEALLEDPVRFSEGWNFGPEQDSFVPVKKIADQVIRNFQKGKIRYPEEYQSGNAKNDTNYHEANLLFLDITKAKQKLKWTPKLNMEETIDFTAQWYKEYKEFTEDRGYQFCCQQIAAFMECSH